MDVGHLNIFHGNGDKVMSGLQRSVCRGRCKVEKTVNIFLPIP